MKRKQLTHEEALALRQLLKDTDKQIESLQSFITSTTNKLISGCPHEDFFVHEYRANRKGEVYTVNFCNICHTQFGLTKIK